MYFTGAFYHARSRRTFALPYAEMTLYSTEASTRGTTTLVQSGLAATTTSSTAAKAAARAAAAAASDPFAGEEAEDGEMYRDDTMKIDEDDDDGGPPPADFDSFLHWLQLEARSSSCVDPHKLASSSPSPQSANTTTTTTTTTTMAAAAAERAGEPPVSSDEIPLDAAEAARFGRDGVYVGGPLDDGPPPRPSGLLRRDRGSYRRVFASQECQYLQMRAYDVAPGGRRAAYVLGDHFAGPGAVSFGHSRYRMRRFI